MGTQTGTRQILWWVSIVLLIALGALVAGLFWPWDAAELADAAAAPTTGLGGPNLWLQRRADLLVQVGLMLAGALGIRALLPGDEEA